MGVPRENCIVLDTSILPKRPNMADIESFVYNKMQLDMSLVTSVQPHNVKNVVFIGIQTKQAAENIASTHHLKHCMEYDGKKFPLPIYVENTAVDVRIHDLPTNWDNLTIIDHMRQYGEIISIRGEIWKSYFKGHVSGIRILRMKLNHPIPSYIIVDDEPTLVTYKNQVKTCKNCSRKSHPNQRCSEVAAEAPAAAATTTATATTAAAAAAAATVVPSPSPSSSSSAAAKQNSSSHQNSNSVNNNTKKTKNTDETTQRNENTQRHADATNEHQSSSLSKPVGDAGQQKNKRTTMNKRQRSIDSETTNNPTKKTNATDPPSSDSDSSLDTVIEICPYTQRPYDTPSYEWIQDEEQKRALAKEYKQTMDKLYLEQLNLGKNT